MMEHRPYALKSSRSSSDGYYQAIAAYTNAWFENAHTTLRKPVEGFLAFLNTRSADVPARGFNEAAFEMLVLGVLLREHGCQALDMPVLPAWLLARLIETQDALPLAEVEKPIKAMRGWIQGMVQEDEAPGAPEAVDLKPFRGSAAGLVERLMGWMRSANMAAQAERMEGWRDYMACLDEQQAQALLARCLLLADDFAETSAAALSEYTTGADAFLEDARSGARWRYDAPLITRTRIEYHLGMLGTEVLTRAYRARYLAAGRKIVIMPDCLCAHTLRVQDAQDAGADQVRRQRCQAEKTSLGGKCTGCAPGCKARQITALGEKHGFEAYILPDDLRGVGVGSCSKLVDVGVVGISCVLTNWDAGWQVHDAGVPCQGVLLDYAGCRSHWDVAGLPTDVNLKHLLATVGVHPTVESASAPA
jgi:hypothetical protein